MKILGIDHGANSGYALIKNDNCIEIDSFMVTGKTQGDKFLNFYNKVNNIICRTKPNIIAMEKPMSFLNASTTRLLIGYYTVIQLLATVHEIKVIEVYPTSMKKKLTGSGKADKLEVCHSLMNRYLFSEDDLLEYEYFKRKKGIKNTYYDKSDALALATYANLIYEEDK